MGRITCETAAECQAIAEAQQEVVTVAVEGALVLAVFVAVATVIFYQHRRRAGEGGHE